MHSLSGTMAISETSLKNTALMTIEEINAAGGVLGIYITVARRRAEMMRLLLNMARGRWEQNDQVEIHQAETASLRSAHQGDGGDDGGRGGVCGWPSMPASVRPSRGGPR